jgi:Transposase zinc-binding domain
VSLDQLKVMSAIERCRTAALGGHVARCENAACGHTEIAYNSCLMGKSINGELATSSVSLSDDFGDFALHYGSPLGGRHRLVRKPNGFLPKGAEAVTSIASSFLSRLQRRQFSTIAGFPTFDP